ncbi:hypothetical protein ASG70_03045 [Phycicoccus sp. Soil748]|nr:hypothetical protein ASG70_03045 [Phycicoccus sp. Soil748]
MRTELIEFHRSLPKIVRGVIEHFDFANLEARREVSHGLAAWVQLLTNLSQHFGAESLFMLGCIRSPHQLTRLCVLASKDPFIFPREEVVVTALAVAGKDGLPPTPCDRLQRDLLVDPVRRDQLCERTNGA